MVIKGATRKAKGAEAPPLPSQS